MSTTLEQSRVTIRTPIRKEGSRRRRRRFPIFRHPYRYTDRTDWWVRYQCCPSTGRCDLCQEWLRKQCLAATTESCLKRWYCDYACVAMYTHAVTLWLRMCGNVHASVEPVISMRWQCTRVLWRCCKHPRSDTIQSLNRESFYQTFRYPRT